MKESYGDKPSQSSLGSGKIPYKSGSSGGSSKEIQDLRVSEDRSSSKQSYVSGDSIKMSSKEEQKSGKLSPF